MKSEWLKKLEHELKDLEKWLQLSLVPKKDLEKHKLEIAAIKAKIEEENQLSYFLTAKERGGSTTKIKSRDAFEQSPSHLPLFFKCLEVAIDKIFTVRENHEVAIGTLALAERYVDIESTDKALATSRLVQGR